MRSVGIGVLVALLSVLGCKGGKGKATPTPAGNGTVSGTVTIAGPPPELGTIVPDVDVETCGKTPRPERDITVADNKGVASAVVTLRPTGGQVVESRVPNGAQIEQGACQFHPFVVPIRVGGSIRVVNNDPILHNVHVNTWANNRPGEDLHNLAQPAGSEAITLKFAKPGGVRVDCDLHSWMRGWVLVTEAPLAAVTNNRGAWKLPDVPAGTYELAVWHNWTKAFAKAITVEPGEQTVDVEVLP